MKTCSRFMPRFLIFLIICAGLAVPAQSQDDAAELVEELGEKYDDIDNISVTFTQKTVFAVTRAEQETGGSLTLEKKNRYRIEFEERVIVSDGVTVWSWSKPNRQVIIDSYREDPNSLTPERLLFNIPRDYGATMLGEEKIGKTEMTILKLTPKSRKASVRWFKLWIDEDDLLIRRIQVLDLSENEITYELSDMEFDRKPDASTFRFEIPPGTEILDLR